MTVLSRVGFVWLVAALVGVAVALDVVGSRLGWSRWRRLVGTTGVLGNGALVLTSVGSGGVFGLSVSPPLPGTAAAAIHVVSLVLIALSLASLYRWRRDVAGAESPEQPTTRKDLSVTPHSAPPIQSANVPSNCVSAWRSK